MWLAGYSSIRRWFKPFSPRTRGDYLPVANDFFEDFAGPELEVKDPDSLVVLWDKAKPRDVVDQIEKFAAAKQTQGSRINRISIMRSFFTRTVGPLPKMSESFMPGEHRGYRREEIKDLLLGVGDAVRRLYVLIAKDSGLRAHHLGRLRYEHVAEEIDRPDKFVFLKLRQEFYPHRKPAGRTFIGPEAVELLRQLIQVGRIKKNPASPILDVTYQTITHELRDARDKAGLDKQIQPSHGLRKFFDNSLDKADLNSNVQNLLEGRGLGVRGWHYTDRNVDELREAYKKAYPFLNLEDQPSESLSDTRVAQFEQKFKEQETLITELHDANQQFAARFKEWDVTHEAFERIDIMDPKSRMWKMLWARNPEDPSKMIGLKTKGPLLMKKNSSSES